MFMKEGRKTVKVTTVLGGGGSEGRSSIGAILLTVLATKPPPIQKDVCSNRSDWSVMKIISDCMK
jgi:hypothetical protein